MARRQMDHQIARRMDCCSSFRMEQRRKVAAGIVVVRCCHSSEWGSLSGSAKWLLDAQRSSFHEERLNCRTQWATELLALRNPSDLPAVAAVPASAARMITLWPRKP